MIHRLFRGHWPRWEPCCYDFLTWRYRCVVCESIPQKPED